MRKTYSKEYGVACDPGVSLENDSEYGIEAARAGNLIGT